MVDCTLPPGTLDEADDKYGCLVVLTYAGREDGSGHALWLCQCNSGEPRCKGRVVVRGARLRSRRASSCGALRGNAGIRRAATLKTPARRRREIARMGGEARKLL